MHFNTLLFASPIQNLPEREGRGRQGSQRNPTDSLQCDIGKDP